MGRHKPPNLRRSGRPIRDPRLAVTVFCEGDNTEPEYFKQFAREHGNQLVKIEPIGAAGVPMTIAQKAVEEQKRRTRRRRNSFEERDQVWVAFDRDEHPNVPEAIRLAEKNGVSVAFSNPCFELWAIVHLVDHEFNRPLHRREAQCLLRELMPKYDPNGSKMLDYQLLSPRFEAACRQAENMEKCREREGDVLGNPFTSVYKLTRLIQEAGRPESKVAATSTV